MNQKTRGLEKNLKTKYFLQAIQVKIKAYRIESIKKKESRRQSQANNEW